VTATDLHLDLYRALTGSACICDRVRIEDDDRLPRIVRYPRPECDEHRGERL
jgi:hypothetical protein